MSPQRTLTVTSLLTLLLFTLHWADEISRGMEPGTMSSLWGFGILFVWIYGTLAIGDKRSGVFVQLLASLLGAAVPIVHMQHAGWMGGHIPINSPGALFWAWTMVAMGVCGMLTAALAVRVLWSMSSLPKAGKSGARG